MAIGAGTPTSSFEPGRQDFVTLLANYVPLQDVYGGPNFFTLDPAGLYEIHVDNNGDGREDITFQFQFTNTSRDFALQIGDLTETPDGFEDETVWCEESYVYFLEKGD